MAGRIGHFLMISASVPLLGAAAGCGSADRDVAEKHRALAERTCEEAVLGQLTSRATAHFDADSEHVYYDSTGGAGVTGVVSTVRGDRNFACILKPGSDSSWTLTAARLLD